MPTIPTQDLTGADQSGCARTEALRLAAEPIPESVDECEFGDDEYQWRLWQAGL